MRKKVSKQHRILAIAPSTRGIGFAVMEGQATLVDWGVQLVKGDKNARSLERVEALIDHYHPEVLVVEDHTTTRRSDRIRELGQQIITLGKARKVRVTVFTRKQV